MRRIPRSARKHELLLAIDRDGDNTIRGVDELLTGEGDTRIARGIEGIVRTGQAAGAQVTGVLNVGDKRLPPKSPTPNAHRVRHDDDDLQIAA